MFSLFRLFLPSNINVHLYLLNRFSKSQHGIAHNNVPDIGKIPKFPVCLIPISFSVYCLNISDTQLCFMFQRIHLTIDFTP